MHCSRGCQFCGPRGTNIMLKLKMCFLNTDTWSHPYQFEEWFTAERIKLSRRQKVQDIWKYMPHPPMTHSPMTPFTSDSFTNDWTHSANDPHSPMPYFWMNHLSMTHFWMTHLANNPVQSMTPIHQWFIKSMTPFTNDPIQAIVVQRFLLVCGFYQN